VARIVGVALDNVIVAEPFASPAVPVTAIDAPWEFVTEPAAIVGTTNVIAVGLESPSGRGDADESKSLTERVFPPHPLLLVFVVADGDARFNPDKVIA
jgi:hypothetical protein